MLSRLSGSMEMGRWSEINLIHAERSLVWNVAVNAWLEESYVDRALRDIVLVVQ